MIKRIIFDLDNTLIMWKKEYEKVVDDSLDAVNYPKTEDLYVKINDTESEYEKEIETTHFEKHDMIDYINKKLNLSLPYEVMDLWSEKVGNCAPEKYPEEDYKTLEYLSKKYELAILTNWYIEDQKRRLEKAGILKFFTHFYGAEKYIKPYKESFLQAVGNFSLDEVAMVGDNLELDVKGAMNAGIKKVVWRDVKNLESEKRVGEIDVIHKLVELREIF